MSGSITNPAAIRNRQRVQISWSSRAGETCDLRSQGAPQLPLGSRRRAVRIAAVGVTGWLLLAVAVLVVLGVLIVVQQRHHTDLVDTLTSIGSEDVRVGIGFGRSANLVRAFAGSIASVDPRSRWVTFGWLEADDDVTGPADAYAISKAAELAELGVLADRIQWIEPTGGPRIRLN
jgi:hypothetical protein